jgi:hypothetical protein
MKKLTAEEANAIIPAAQGRTTTVSAMLATLAIGEALIITRTDWGSKSGPYRIVNYYSKKTGRLFTKGRMPDGSGWFIKRIQ